MEKLTGPKPGTKGIMETLESTLQRIIARFRVQEQSEITEPAPSPNSNTSDLATEWQRRYIGLLKVTPAVQVMADAVQKWARNVYQNDKTHRLCVLTGCWGCGKTVAARGALNFVRDAYMDVYGRTWGHPITPTFVSFPEYCPKAVADKADEWREDILASHVIVLDDVGAEDDRFKSGTPARVLGDLLSDLERKFVLITTNTEPRFWREKWGGRVEDRLNRNSVIVDLWKHNARSYAQMLKEKV